MANPPPPYDGVSGITRTIMKDNEQETIPNYDGNARPGELVIDLSNNDIYIGNTNGNLNLIFATSGATGNGVPAGPVGAVQFNAGGNLFGGTANLVVLGTGISAVGNVQGGNIISNSIVNASSGNVTVTGNLIPISNVYTLGTSADPWGNAFFGPESITILDSTGNLANSVVIENIAANITLGTTGFTINQFGTLNPIFRIEALTGQIFSNAQTIIANSVNSSNTTSGSLQTAGGAGIVKDLWVGGNIYGTGAELSNVVNSITAGAGIITSASTGDITIGSTAVLGVNGTINQINVANVGNVLTLSLPQNFNTTANVQLYSLTVNDLTILGNVSNVIPSVVGGKIVYVANSATTFNDINTSGLVTGNVANSVWAGILYETTSNTWQMDIGNSNGITSDKIYTTQIIANGRVNLGNAYNNYDYVNSLIQADSSIDSYAQIVLQNHFQGANSSADIVAVANNGDDANYYIDMGINSNVYNNADYAVTGFNDGYLYVNGGDLVIGTQTAAKVINFFTGGTNSATYIRGTISDSGLSMVGNVTANNMISTNATIGGLVTATGNVTGGNLIGQNLTSGRVAIVGSGKQVSDTAALTFNNGAGNVLSVTGNVNATIFNGVLYGNVVTTGNVNGGNFNATEAISATGNITTAGNIIGSYGVFSGGNTVINANISTSGNVIGSYGVFSGGNTVINATISTTGNVIGANLVTGGLITATGNITGGNIQTAGITSTGSLTASTTISATGNITGGNVAATTFTGNVVGNVTGTATTATNLAAATSILAGSLIVNPTNIVKNSASIQTFTLTGLTTSHKIVITSGTALSYGVTISAAWASALNTLSIEFQNATNAGVDLGNTNIQYFAWV